MAAVKSINYAHRDKLPKVAVTFEGESLTRQDQLAQTDINSIVRDFAFNGRITIGSQKEPQFGDFTQLTSYDQVLTFIRDADMAFMELPADERKQYDNDPQKWVESKMAEANQAAEDAAIKAAAEAAEQEEATALANAQKLVDQSKSE